MKDIRNTFEGTGQSRITFPEAHLNNLKVQHGNCSKDVKQIKSCRRISGYFAREWTHIDVAYNFQLHQMFYASCRCIILTTFSNKELLFYAKCGKSTEALSPDCVETADRSRFFGCPVDAMNVQWLINLSTIHPLKWECEMTL